MKQRILFLAANPAGTTERQLDEEARAIEEEIRRASQRDAFEFVTRWATRPLDLLRALRDVRPSLVHFAGHATTDGVYLIDERGQPVQVTRNTLIATFDAAGESVKIVLFSGCATESLAQGLCEVVPVCIGISAAIQHVAARTFSVGFYGGLASGASAARAHLQGQAAMQLMATGGHDQPRLHHGQDIDPEVLVTADAAADADRGAAAAAPTMAAAPGPVASPPAAPSARPSAGSIPTSARRSVLRRVSRWPGRGAVSPASAPPARDRRNALTGKALAAIGLASPVLEVATRKLRRHRVWLALLAVAAAGLIWLAFVTSSAVVVDRGGFPAATPMAASDADARAAARESILQSNPFLPINGAYAMQAHEISEQEWYARSSGRPVDPSPRTSKVEITAREAAEFCAAIGGMLPSIEIWKAARDCAVRPDAPCGLNHLDDSVEELTSSRDDSEPANPLIYVIGGSSLMHPKDPTAARRIPADHRGPVTGARCARRMP
jgi:hypothetical protein